jgi:hypothetical protein
MIVLFKKKLKRYAFSDLRCLLCLVGRHNCGVTLQSSKSSGLEVENLNFHFFYGIYLHIPMGILTPKARFGLIRDWLLPSVFCCRGRNPLSTRSKIILLITI